MTPAQAVQGLMRHVDAGRAIKTPLGFIPAGTGNGICCSMGLWGAWCGVVW